MFSKRDHEKVTAVNLVSSVEPTFTFKRLGNDKNEPDVIFEDPIGHSIGVEVCLAYYDERDAAQEWTLARGKRKFPTSGYEMRWDGFITEPDKLIYSKIQAEINGKCSIEYSGVDESWLCIEIRALLIDDDSISTCISKLEIPVNNFKHIWLCYRAPLHNGGGYHAKEIAPDPRALISSLESR